MVKILVTYGYHRGEREFGQDVVDYFTRMHPDSVDTLLARQLKGVGRESDDDKEAQSEVQGLIEEHKPELVIDLHCKEGDYDMSEHTFYEPTDRELAMMAEELFPDLDPVDSLMIKVSTPLSATVFEDREHADLASYIHESGTETYRHRETDSPLKKDGISFIGTETLFDVKDGKSVKNENYKSALQMTSDFLDLMVRYITRN